MEVVEILIYVATVALTSLLTYVTGVDLISLAAAALTAYYASIGSNMTVISAITVVLVSIVRIATARPVKSRKALMVKLKYLTTMTTVIAIAIPIAYISAGTAIQLQLVDPWPLAILIAASLYVLVYGLISPTTLHLVSVSFWDMLDLEHVEEFLYKSGVIIGALAMLINVATHGVLGLIMMLIYIVTLFATMKMKLLLHRVVVSLIMAVTVAITYIYGYT